MAITTDCVDKGYSWLLDAVATLRIPLQWLTARNVDELANREGHGLPASEIAARMRELLHDGRIAVTWPLISGGERVLLTGQELVEVRLERLAQQLLAVAAVHELQLIGAVVDREAMRLQAR